MRSSCVKSTWTSTAHSATTSPTSVATVNGIYEYIHTFVRSLARFVAGFQFNSSFLLSMATCKGKISCTTYWPPTPSTTRKSATVRACQRSPPSCSCICPTKRFASCAPNHRKLSWINLKLNIYILLLLLLLLQ